MVLPGERVRRASIIGRTKGRTTVPKTAISQCESRNGDARTLISRRLEADRGYSFSHLELLLCSCTPSLNPAWQGDLFGAVVSILNGKG